MNSEKDTVDFGFEKISTALKTPRISDLFNRVSSRYDLMNDLMSFGMHRLWKRRFVESLPLHDQGRYLDVAGGTGDIASAIAARLKKCGFCAETLVCDLTPGMMEEGRKKGGDLFWVCGNAEDLPFLDGSVDVVTMAFGLRNMTHRDRALQEAHRVLRPGGTFACLEFSHPVAPLQKAYDFYSFQVIPRIGQCVAQDQAAYQYLSESIRTFPSREALSASLREQGFQGVHFEIFTGGIVAVHQGQKAL